MSYLFRFVFFSFFLLQFHCISFGENLISTKRNPELPPEIRQGKVFLAGHIGDHTKDTEEILKILKRLIDGTVAKDLNFLPDLVSKKEGIYLDLKGNWTKEQLISELSSTENYFRTYFFDRELLAKQKGSNEVRTVRDLFLSSGGVEADFYYESKIACELKLRFRENPKLEKELINPYFIKQDGKWYLFRLF
ncbi:hypothetical protein EHQ64_19520 [Leptospira sarikeiensis]|uniref:Uncharacterized protein n=1 Tax=Leptospira sarikeiensis TaxID=2484943 RepID=A0A4R9JZL4_9LEPT|nr:hypothetical protein EHQ64_19520 [Leptospira sarikeiensis]